MANITQFEVPDLEPVETRVWKMEAAKLQNAYYNTYHDKIWWKGIPSPGSVTIQLEHAVGQTLYSHIQPTNEQELSLKKSGYKRTEIAQIRRVTTRVLKHFKSEETSLSVILICAIHKNNSLAKRVFRVWDSSKEYFIDGGGRVYKNWDVFLNENLFPKCLLCYPAFGIYKVNENNEVLVDYGRTPACNSKSQTTIVLEISSLVISLIAIALFIVAAATGDTAIYAAGLVVLIIGLPYRLYMAFVKIRDIHRHS